MVSMSGFDFYALNFDANGNLTNDSEFPAMRQAARGATDAIFLAHGFRNDVNDANQVYSGFLGTFRGHLARPEFQEIARRKYVVGGVYWPSKVLPESFGMDAGGGTQSVDPKTSLMILATQKLIDLKSTVPAKAAALDQAAALLPSIEADAAAQDQFTELVMSVLEGSRIDVTEGLPLVRQQKGSEMLPKLAAPLIFPTNSSGAEGDSSGGTQALGDIFAGTQFASSELAGILGGVDKFLNLMTWFLMKDRSGIVGESGAAQAVRAVRAANQSIQIHLVGHSLGGRLMAACAKSLAQTPIVQPDSMMLLEAAFSHYGFSANNGQGIPGFFRDVIAKHVVKGPLIETFSYQDTVVGSSYALASRLAGDNLKAIGDADDEFGGIGRNGCQRTAEASVQPLKPASTATTPYIFRTGIVNCLDGSGGLIKDHGDVINADVTYAFASAVASTRSVEMLTQGATV